MAAKSEHQSLSSPCFFSSLSCSVSLPLCIIHHTWKPPNCITFCKSPKPSWFETFLLHFWLTLQGSDLFSITIYCCWFWVANVAHHLYDGMPSIAALFLLHFLLQLIRLCMRFDKLILDTHFLLFFTLFFLSLYSQRWIRDERKWWVGRLCFWGVVVTRWQPNLESCPLDLRLV